MSLKVWGIPSPPRCTFVGSDFSDHLFLLLSLDRELTQVGVTRKAFSVLPIKGFSRHTAPPRPDPAASPKHAGNVSRCSRQTASTWYLSPNMEPVWSEWGGRGWGAQWASLGREGLVGRLRGDITALAPFKPLTQPASHPICPAQALTLLSFKPRNN